MSAQLNFNVAFDPKTDIPWITPDGEPDAMYTGRFEPGRYINHVPTNVPGGGTLWYDNGQESIRLLMPLEDRAYEAGNPAEGIMPPEYAGDSSKMVLDYRPTVDLQPFYMDGKFPRTQDGSELFFNCATLFRAFDRFLHNEFAVLDPACEQLHDEGFNGARVFLLNDTTYLDNPALVYQVGPIFNFDFYPRLPDFMRYMAGFGLFVDWVAVCRGKTLMPNWQDQVEYLTQLFSVLAPFPSLGSKVNEHNVHDNGITDQAIAVPPPFGAQFLLSNGSNGADSDTVEPVAQSIEYHSNDLNEWQRKSGHNCWELGNVHNRPARCSEQTRAADKDNNPAHFEDNAKGLAAMLTAGCFHSVSGKNAEPLTDAELEMARAHNRGIADVKAAGLWNRRGAYVRRDDLIQPGIIRGYQMGSYVWTVRA